MAQGQRGASEPARRKGRPKQEIRAAHEVFDALEKQIEWTRKTLEDVEADINELED